MPYYTGQMLWSSKWCKSNMDYISLVIQPDKCDSGSPSDQQKPNSESIHRITCKKCKPKPGKV